MWKQGARVGSWHTCRIMAHLLHLGTRAALEPGQRHAGHMSLPPGTPSEPILFFLLFRTRAQNRRTLLLIMGAAPWCTTKHSGGRYLRQGARKQLSRRSTGGCCPLPPSGWSTQCTNSSASSPAIGGCW